MKTLPCCAAALLAAGILGHARVADAITLPDSSYCSSSSSCLAIGNQVIGGRAIEGDASMNGIGVKGVSLTGYAGVGLQGIAEGHGVEGTSFGTQGGAIGVIGTIPSNSAGSAIYGEAHNGTGYAGNFDGKVGAFSYVTFSDARLKTDLKDESEGLQQLLRLRPVTYRFKKGANGVTHHGLIAQDVQKIFPELVETDSKSGMLSINYQELLPVTIKVVQDQQKMILEQNRRIEALERERTPVASSMFSGTLDRVCLAMLPIGLFVVAARKRRSRAL